MESVSLDQSALDQLQGEQKALLDTIDDLRNHGISRFVDLPQIIVVGDQSSGKSSVLEAISRVRFPVKDGLCTRFATELVLRTQPQTRVNVRIQNSTSIQDQGHDFNETNFDKDELPRIIEKAKTRMLRDNASFSEDVLRVEISGPDVPHLTLVDLPGFYHSEDENQSEDGREIVDRLVERYMARKNSIILAIISARNQVILQKVLSKVKQHDRNKERTLGIITKPDLLATGSQDETNFVRLAKNLERSHELSLGWHVLRNRSETEESDSHEERDQKEHDFFESGPWSAIPSRNRGVGTLRKRLSTILLTHIRNNLQGLIEAIEDSMNEHQKQLKHLGEPRTTPKELRRHLDNIASQFHLLSLHAVEGNYSDDFFGGLYHASESSFISDSRVKKLRALVRDLNRAFAWVLATKGSRRTILAEDSDDDDDYNKNLSSDVTLPPFLQSLANQYRFADPSKVTLKSVSAELEALSSANQGNEFPGTANDRLAVKLFQDQSQPWEAIAQFHLLLVLRVSKSFVEKVVNHVIGPDKKTSSAVFSEIVDPFFEKKSETLQLKLQELLHHYRSGYPQPLDAEFRASLANRRQKSLMSGAIQELIARRPELFTEDGRQALSKETQVDRKSEFGVEGLIDKAETYYEMSLRTFTDNVIVLAIENGLITDLPSIFTTERVNQMEDDELERLASESQEIQVERTELRAEFEALKKGLQLCNKYRARKATVIPPVLVDMAGLSLSDSAAEVNGRGTATMPTNPPSPAVPSSTPSRTTLGQQPTSNVSGHQDAGSGTGKGVFGASHNTKTPLNTFSTSQQSFGTPNTTPSLFGARTSPSPAHNVTPLFGTQPSTNGTPGSTLGASLSTSGGDGPVQRGMNGSLFSGNVNANGLTGGLFAPQSSANTASSSTSGANPFAKGNSGGLFGGLSSANGTPGSTFGVSPAASGSGGFPSGGNTATAGFGLSSSNSSKLFPNESIFPKREPMFGNPTKPKPSVDPLLYGPGPFFTLLTERESSVSSAKNHFKSIFFQPPFKDYSPEEVRLLATT